MTGVQTCALPILKVQYFGHLMRRADSLEKTLMLVGIEGTADCHSSSWPFENIKELLVAISEVAQTPTPLPKSNPVYWGDFGSVSLTGARGLLSKIQASGVTLVTE